MKTMPFCSTLASALVFSSLVFALAFVVRPVGTLIGMEIQRRFGRSAKLTAALFLQDFVPSGIPWAHIDIAGPSFNEKGAYGYLPKGGTGSAVRTLVQVAAEMAAGRT